MQPPNSHISPDGHWRWDGSQWVSTRRGSKADIEAWARQSPPPVGALSYSGGWRWSGEKWIAVESRPTEITVTAGTAFKIGFFGLIGAFVASILPGLLLLAVFGSCLASLGHH